MYDLDTNILIIEKVIYDKTGSFIKYLPIN